MANNNAVYQQMTNVSIPRDRLMWLAADDGMSKKAYKVMLCLFTQLDGYNKITQRRTKDPQNFKMIDFKAISGAIGVSKKEVKGIVSDLIDAGYVEIGSSNTINEGYRFTF